MKEKSMKKQSDEMRDEYDFSSGVRGKYAKRYAQGTNVVVIEPDLHKQFPNSKEVNKALRKFLRIKELARK